MIGQAESLKDGMLYTRDLEYINYMDIFNITKDTTIIVDQIKKGNIMVSEGDRFVKVIRTMPRGAKPSVTEFRFKNESLSRYTYEFMIK
jgi:hypothetical protein